MIAESGVKIQNGYKLRSIEPPDLKDYDASTRNLFWSWVVDFGLKRKDKELSQGLDKDGNPLRPISKETRQNRRSAMTPSGKGDPDAPPLTPGFQKSRTRSLLTGRAFSTHCEFFWLYDAWTGASWGVVLSYQAAKGRDVFGLSKAGTAWVKSQAFAKWERWKQGKVRTVPTGMPRQTAPAPKFDQRFIEHIEAGPSTGGGAAFMPGRSSGFSTPEQRRKYFSQTADAVIPGRAKNPKSQSPIAGPKYNRLLGHVHGVSKPAPPPGMLAAKPRQKFPTPGVSPLQQAPTSSQAKKKSAVPKSPAAPQRFSDHDAVIAWAKEVFPNATIHVDGIALESWHLIADELDHMIRKFPAAIEKITVFGSVDAPQHALAYVTPKGTELRFNRRSWSDVKKINKTFLKGATTGWHPSHVEHAGPSYYVSHEYGHLVDFHMKERDPSRYQQLHEHFKDPEHPGWYSRARAGLISEYGQTNELEAVAETFAAARWRKDGDNPIVNVFREDLGL